MFIELLEFSEDRSPWDSVEEKLNEIRYEQFPQFLRQNETKLATATNRKVDTTNRKIKK